jgi:hypothetical protein
MGEQWADNPSGPYLGPDVTAVLANRAGLPADAGFVTPRNPYPVFIILRKFRQMKRTQSKSFR